MKLASPLKQMKMGVDAHEIQCNPEYSLVFKATNWSPACVKSSSVERLMEIGWAAGHDVMDKDHMIEKDSMMKEEDAMMEKMEKSIAGVDLSMASPVEGSPDAPVTIIEFGDYQCPKCDQWFKNEKPTITSDFIDTARANLYFVDFAFLGEDSKTSSEASYCADEQGSHRYRPGTLESGCIEVSLCLLYAHGVSGSSTVCQAFEEGEFPLGILNVIEVKTFELHKGVGYFLRRQGG